MYIIKEFLVEWQIKQQEFDDNLNLLELQEKNENDPAIKKMIKEQILSMLNERIEKIKKEILN